MGRNHCDGCGNKENKEEELIPYHNWFLCKNCAEKSNLSY